MFARAQRMEGITSDNMLSLLEQRFDNTVFRMGFAVSRAQARQMVSHCYFYVNEKPANVPSMRIKAKDVITSKEKKGIQNLIRHNLVTSQGNRGSWLTVDEEKLSATVTALPAAGDIQPVGNIQYVIEFYSR